MSSSTRNMVYSKTYTSFFNLATLFGILPFKLEEDGTVVNYHRSGPIKMWSTLNTTLLLLYICYQIGMIIAASLWGDVGKLEWFQQSCWIIMALFPLPSLNLYGKKRERLCEFLSQWLQLEKDLIGGKKESNQGKDKEISTIFMRDPKVIKEGMEYDNFRRGLFCYHAQQRTFKKLMWLYAFLALMTACVIGLHNLVDPTFTTYVTFLLDRKMVRDYSMVIYVSSALHFYMAGLCVIHVGSFEILLMACVRSIRHCIESLSNLNSVSMERRAICGRRKPKDDTLDVATIAENIEKMDATQRGSRQEMEVEEAADNYRRVEFAVENLNECFRGSFLGHQTLYLAMMCVLIFVFLRSPGNTTFMTTAVFTVSFVSFTLRICCLLPFLGKLGEDSEVFIYSWLEEIPKLLRGGKPYQTAEVKLHACRILGINCGDYYDIQGSTVLTFFSIVTTYLIILLQL